MQSTLGILCLVTMLMVGLVAVQLVLWAGAKAYGKHAATLVLFVLASTVTSLHLAYAQCIRWG